MNHQAAVITGRVGSIPAEDAEEKFEVFDENNVSLGATVLRSQVHAKGLWHR